MIYSKDRSRAVYGIDLGTTYSCVAQVDAYDQAVVLPNADGEYTTPSAVYFKNRDTVLVGTEAKGMLVSEPENTVVFVKRLMGVDSAFDKENNDLPYHYDPSEVSAMILKKMVDDINRTNNTGEPIKDVVITCPAYFGTKEKMQTRQAGEIAGLNVIGIINEPTAAAIAYGVKRNEAKTVLVYDLGGGTFDVTIININGGAIKVVATGGDHHLGGVDWDTALSEFILAVFNEQNGTDFILEDNESLKYSLLLEAERWKKMLSAKSKTVINFQYAGMSCRCEITRDMFNELTRIKLQETIDCMERVISSAKSRGYNRIDEFILVGGSSRMPQIKERIDKEFGCNAKLTDPDQCVAKGAAIYAMNEAYLQAVDRYEKGLCNVKPEVLRGDRTRVIDVTSKTYGIGIIEHKVRNMIFANTSLPASATSPFFTTMDNQREVIFPIYESDFTDPDTDSKVDECHCTLLYNDTMKISKYYPYHSDIMVTIDIDCEGILHMHATIDDDELDFTLKINGVKSVQEVAKAGKSFGKIRFE